MSKVYQAWWVLGPIAGLILLANSRDQLFQHNLYDTYQPGEYPTVLCTAETEFARTLDGSCNDLNRPAMGMAGMRFGRNVPVSETYPDTDNLMSPNPREISRLILHRDEIIEATQLSYLAAAWIQFMVHDWFSHGTNEAENPMEVPITEDDPLSAFHIQVPRTRVDPSKDPNDGHAPTFQNVVTAWWDGSQIYGSDLATNEQLRSFSGGRLKVENNQRLPLANGIDLTGFTDNWWVGLSLFHHLFVLEHNAIAAMLQTQNPHWDDQKVYDVARLINTAVMAKIHTVDWTPAVLDNNILRIAMIGNWKGLLRDNFKHTGNVILSGIMGSQTDHHGVPYSLTEEFTAVYRMHSFLRDELEVRNWQTHELLEQIELQDTAFTSATQVVDKHGLANLFYSFGHTHPGALTTNNFPKFLTEFPTNEGTLDLAMVDILRDRERGVPRYNQFRRLVQLKPISDFSDLTPNEETVSVLRELYDNDVEKLDLLVGSMAEGYRPPGYGFGETSFQIFIAMASRRLMSDRFFTDYYNAKTYTQAGLDWVAAASINAVLLRHLPELEEALNANGNAFFPWNEQREWAKVNR